MRRLYSSFAGGSPGLGLLLLRLVVGAFVVVRAGPQVWSDAPVTATLASALLAGPGLLLCAGLWTPISGLLVVLLEIARMVRVDEDPMVGLLAAAMAGGLALLGPGRWSIDARVFGWKRIDAPLRKT